MFTIPANVHPGKEIAEITGRRVPNKMREKYQKQMPLMNSIVSHPHAEELQQISRILDDNPIIIDLAMQDLMRGVNKPGKGAKGMTADQVVRCRSQKCVHAEIIDFHYLKIGSVLGFGSFFGGFADRELNIKSIGKDRPGAEKKENEVPIHLSLGTCHSDRPFDGFQLIPNTCKTILLRDEYDHQIVKTYRNQ